MKPTFFEFGLKQISRTHLSSRTINHKLTSGLHSIQNSFYNIVDILEDSVEIMHTFYRIGPFL